MFALSFIVSLIILGSLFAVFLLYMKSSGANSNKEDVTYKSNYTPSEGENLTILFLGCEDKSKSPTLIHLIHYDAINSSVYLAALSPKTVCTIKEKKQTLTEAYDYYGLDGAINGCKNIFSSDITAYVRFDITQMEDFVSFFGGVDFDVPKPLTFGKTNLDAGNQMLDSRRFCAFMFANERNPQYQSQLLEKLLRSKFNKSMLLNYDVLCKKIFDTNDTNINSYDIIKRKTGFMRCVSNESILIKAFVIDGDFDESGTKFNPQPQSIEKIAQLLH